MTAVASRLRAVLLQRCPRCLQGPIFHGLMTMHKDCPVCGHHFEREPGYFLGAMYASYFLAVPLLLILYWLLWWFLPAWRGEYLALLTVVPYLLVVPWVFRYSRVIWMHIDPPA